MTIETKFDIGDTVYMPKEHNVFLQGIVENIKCLGKDVYYSVVFGEDNYTNWYSEDVISNMPVNFLSYARVKETGVAYKIINYMIEKKSYTALKNGIEMLCYPQTTIAYQLANNEWYEEEELENVDFLSIKDEEFWKTHRVFHYVVGYADVKKNEDTGNFYVYTKDKAVIGSMSPNLMSEWSIVEKKVDFSAVDSLGRVYVVQNNILIAGGDMKARGFRFYSIEDLKQFYHADFYSLDSSEKPIGEPTRAVCIKGEKYYKERFTVGKVYQIMISKAKNSIYILDNEGHARTFDMDVQKKFTKIHDDMLYTAEFIILED